MGNLNFKRGSTKESTRFIYPSNSSCLTESLKNKKYPPNSIRTQKYNVFTFIPKNLFEQFHRFANIYFVFILILNFMPYIQAFAKEVAPIPVLFVLSVTAIKDIVEDFRRYKSDKRVNNSTCLVYDSVTNDFQCSRWKNLKCGDYVKMNANETIPADMIVLHSKDKSGVCHIETANLDGETNLKQREVISLELNEKFNPQQFSSSYIEVENPNKEIYKFNGTVHKLNSNDKIPLKKNNLLLRGCLLRNTEEVIGLIVYTGKETKTMLNNNEKRFKRSKLERQINKDVIWCVLILIFVCLFNSIGEVLWLKYQKIQDFMEYNQLPEDLPEVLKNPAMQGFLTFWRCVIYYQAMIPLPLYVTFEIVKMYQVYIIRNDKEMWDPETNTGLEVRAFNIPEDLGQVQYIFCDKTGTLTENRMEFRRAFIDGLDYVHHINEDNSNDRENKENDENDNEEKKIDEKEKNGNNEKHLNELLPILNQGKYDKVEERYSGNTKVIRDFFLLMAICNTTVVSLNKNENKPVIKTKKAHDFRHKLIRNFQNAGDDIKRKAASLSSFTPKNFFTKSGRSSFKDLEQSINNDSLVNRDPTNPELVQYKRKDSDVPILKIVPEEGGDHKITHDNSNSKNKNQLNPSIGNSSSRKVRSVIDFGSSLSEQDFEDVHNFDDYEDNGNEDKEVDVIKERKFNSLRVKVGPSSDVDEQDYADSNWSQNSSFYNHPHNNEGGVSVFTSTTTMGGLITPDEPYPTSHSNNHLSPTLPTTDKHASSTNCGSETPSDVTECPMSDTSLLESYESESPDEMALVKTACNYGFKLLQRGQSFVTIWNPGRKQAETYQVLQLLPFDSVRKKMSIIVRIKDKSGPVTLFCKGADSSMLPVLNKNTDVLDMENTKDYVNEYARMGLRTLVLAKKEISGKVFEEWQNRYKAAEGKLFGNEEEINKLMDEIEQDLLLLGVTGIEDCLQEGVPDTIASLRKAGISIWVLTGDKQETAINIAYSASLFNDNHRIITLNGDNKMEIQMKIQQNLDEIVQKYPAEIAEMRQGHLRPMIRRDLALCIDGDALALILKDGDLKIEFLHLAEQCSSVVCARSTPMQKSEVVQLVKENLRMQTLAIGDGANDVSMIQTADIGIGIGGLEGMQAVMASDFSMTKFRFLKRLLLVHGSWCYNKLARTALYMFYKDAIYILIMFWYQIHNTFSVSIMIDQLTQILFNITMTGLPPIIYGILDIDVKARILESNPQLYRHGVNCKTYQPWHFWVNILDSIYQSLVIFYMCFGIYNDTDMSFYEFGQVIVGCALITCLVHLGVETRFWNFYHVIGLLFSFIFAWFCFTIAYNNICINMTCALDNQQDYLMHNVIRPSFWILLIITPAVAVLPRLVITALVNTIRPSILSEALQRESNLGPNVDNLQFHDDCPELISVKHRDTIFNSILGSKKTSICNVDRTMLGFEYGGVGGSGDTREVPSTSSRSYSCAADSCKSIITKSSLKPHKSQNHNYTPPSTYVSTQLPTIEQELSPDKSVNSTTSNSNEAQSFLKHNLNDSYLLIATTKSITNNNINNHINQNMSSKC